MDTTAYLTGQGWLGTGHSLHPTGRGIKKPLLVAQKSNVLGVGKKKYDAHADQWWARVFDAGLKNLEVGRNESTGATQSVTAGTWGQLDTLKAGGQKWAGNRGLYAGFVRGEVLSGTITPEVIGDERKGGDGSDGTESGGKGLAREKRKRGAEGCMDEDDRRHRSMAKKSKNTPVAIAEDATKCLGWSMKTAPLVMDGNCESEVAQVQQHEGSTSIEARKLLLDEDAGVEPTGKAGCRKKKRRKDSSQQETTSPEQFTPNPGIVRNRHGSLVNRSLEPTVKRLRKRDRKAN
ncbi:hypothetical protein MMC30_003189 [Trapelia coarctata]|nr:hypothetical protein [Trapelia coarctata]